MSEPVEVKSKVKLSYPPVIHPLLIERGIFEETENDYKLFRHLVETDDTLWGGLHTAAVLTKHCLQGFVVKVGEQLEPAEKRLQDELDLLYRKVLSKYTYDIAWKLLLDGTAVYALDVVSGVQALHWLPMPYLTCVEKEEDIAKLEWLRQHDVPKRVTERKTIRLEELRPYLLTTQVMKKGVFIINELDESKRQTWKVEDCAVFDWGKTEIVKDLLGRWTYGVWNHSPLLSLRAKILWKHSLILGDMMYRRTHYPREHHKLPSETFDPDLFPGDTYEQRLAAANAAAKKYLEKYASDVMATTTERRLQPDQGYVTFKDVAIDVVESKVAYTSPNELLDQIDRGIPAVTGVPQSAITGAPPGRASFASEVQIGAYLALKAEFVASRIADTYLSIAERHIQAKHKEGTEELKKLDLPSHLHKVEFKLTRILERHQMVRDAAILYELPLTDNEIRAVIDYPPLTDTQAKEIKERRLSSHKHRESTAEAAETAKRGLEPERTPLTPHSEGMRQKT